MKKKMHVKENKNDILLDKIFTLIIVLLVGSVIGVLLDKALNKQKECEKCVPEKVTSIYDIEPIVKEYTTINKNKVYLYNTNEILINDISLKEYINSYKNIDDLFNSLGDNIEEDKKLQDGGTTIYKTKTDSKFNKDLTIIKCNTTEGNKDLYFGEYLNTETAFLNGACGKKMIQDEEFQKVYLIKKIKKLEEDNLYELLIVDQDSSKSVTLTRKISEESIKNLYEGKLHTFVFTNKYKELIKDDIEEIFESATLKGVALYKEN